MSILNRLKQLIGATKLASPQFVTPIETIEFPNTYKNLNFYIYIPTRPDNAMSGSEFGQSILHISERDNLIYQECVKGNIPEWMNNLKAITVQDQQNSLTYYVSPDVLCIGSDDDFLRVSLNGYTARRVVDLFNCMLPTQKMSDQIWANADLKMIPEGMGASPNMTNTQTLINHNNIIEKQRAGRNFTLIAGIKKDIIFHSQLLIYKNNICIYGWHYPSGQPIQDAQYKAHNIFYYDYSHSIRLISKRATLNGQFVNLYDILNSQYSYLISYDKFNANKIYT